MAISGWNRRARWLERTVLLVLLAYLGAHTLPRAWGRLNTDFPNYYLAAKLAREGYDTSRLYEWVWLQREKDHLAMDVKVIGLLPITPFSTLPMVPLTRLTPLGAKHVWLLLNLALLVPLCGLLSRMTGLSWQRVALVFAASFPLHRNLLYGQFYLLLLLLIVAACMAYLRGRQATAGVLVALAAACKIFPVLLFVFFVQRRAWRGVVAGALTGVAALAISIRAFGWNLHWTYLREVLPWTLHGEGLPPYDTASESISSVLHLLFLDEPQWNPHPWHRSLWMYALLQPVISMLIVAPAVLLMRRERQDGRTIQLEWSALLVACLAVSTIPASYNFVLLAFPVCVMAAALLERGRYGWLALLAVLYIGIGLPFPAPHGVSGPAILLHLPRLPLLLALLAGNYLLLWSGELERKRPWEWTQYAWAAAMAAAAVVSVHSTLEREQAVRQEYACRLPLQTEVLLAARPQDTAHGIGYVAFTSTGYRLEGLQNGDDAGDGLSFAASGQGEWVEKGLSPHSEIVGPREATRSAIQDARAPMPARDQKSLAYVRDRLGRGRLLLRGDFVSSAATDITLSPASLNVYEASFLSKTEYAFAAVAGDARPLIYLTDATHQNAPLPLGEARYPALSSDGRWLAYSRLESGVWNLWLRDERSGETRRIAKVPCNQIEASWKSDGKTLLYSTDCGRSLWFTGIAQRRVLP